MRVALLQLNSQESLDKNLVEIDALLKEASSKGSTYALLPENFAFFGSEKEKLKRANFISTEVFEFLKNSALKYNLTLTGGGFPTPATPAKVYNTALTFSPKGEEVNRYNKIHLFDVAPGDNVEYRESRSTEAGDKIAPLFSLDKFLLGITICYDLRFPYLYQNLAANGATVLLVPAAFTQVTGSAHWHTLLRARAIENTCYVLAAAQWGKHSGGRETYGHSLVVDPWGEIIAELSSGVGVLYADLDFTHLNAVRTRMPSVQHRVVLKNMA
ncbi:MAG: Deaminated glutathione amidase [Turneriella sp.]|nr:Deaminated glutathione amidase [Turneriella sp.]